MDCLHILEHAGDCPRQELLCTSWMVHPFAYRVSTGVDSHPARRRFQIEATPTTLVTNNRDCITHIDRLSIIGKVCARALS